MRKSFFIIALCGMFLGVILTGTSCRQYKVVFHELEKEVQEEVFVKLGIDMLEEQNGGILKGKKVGLITNNSGVNQHLESTIDILMHIPDVELVALYGPEHGVRGTIPAGERVETFIDELTGLPVFSLYGAVKAPTQEMLENVDALVFDIQDIGSRSYTYISSMAASMKSARENDIPFVVLDRPNPLTGLYVDGNVADEYGSFVCYYPIPYCHGMTIGELAKLFNEEFDIGCELHVVKMDGWKRWMTWEDTGLVWIPTSPHIPESSTSWFYAMTGIIGELRLVSEGVGYTLPFKLMAAPWMDGHDFAEHMNSYEIPGVRFMPFFYTPYYGPFEGQNLQGVKIAMTNMRIVEPLKVDYYLMDALQKLYPEEFDLKQLDSEGYHRLRMFTLVLGGRSEVEKVLDKKSPEEIFESWEEELKTFKETRSQYLLY